MSNKSKQKTITINRIVPSVMKSIQNIIFYHHNSYIVGDLIRASLQFCHLQNVQNETSLRIRWENVFRILDVNFKSNILLPNQTPVGYLAFNKYVDAFERVFNVNVDKFHVRFKEN